MIHLICISSATSWPSETDLVELLQQLRARNQKQNITGMLIYDNAIYVQVLEGDADIVHEVYQLICKDPRNNGVVKLLEDHIEERDFPDWSMGFKRLEYNPAEALPGFVDVFNGGIEQQAAIGYEFSCVELLMRFVKNV